MTKVDVGPYVNQTSRYHDESSDFRGRKADGKDLIRKIALGFFFSVVFYPLVKRGGPP